jgi:hypothetical protein
MEIVAPLRHASREQASQEVHEREVVRHERARGLIAGIDLTPCWGLNTSLDGVLFTAPDGLRSLHAYFTTRELFTNKQQGCSPTGNTGPRAMHGIMRPAPGKLRSQGEDRLGVPVMSLGSDTSCEFWSDSATNFVISNSSKVGEHGHVSSDAIR